MSCNDQLVSEPPLILHGLPPPVGNFDRFIGVRATERFEGAEDGGYGFRLVLHHDAREDDGVFMQIPVNSP